MITIFGAYDWSFKQQYIVFFSTATKTAMKRTVCTVHRLTHNTRIERLKTTKISLSWLKNIDFNRE